MAYISFKQFQDTSIPLLGGVATYMITKSLLNGIYNRIPAKNGNKPALIQESTVRKIITLISGLAGIGATCILAKKTGLLSRVGQYNSVIPSSQFQGEVGEVFDFSDVE